MVYIYTSIKTINDLLHPLNKYIYILSKNIVNNSFGDDVNKISLYKNGVGTCL